MHNALYQEPASADQLLSFTPCRYGQLVVLPNGVERDFDCFLWVGNTWASITHSEQGELAIWTYVRMCNELSCPALVKPTFFVEQLANFAANYACRAALAEGNGLIVPSEEAIGFILSAIEKVTTLIAEPVDIAVSQLQKDGLYPDHVDALKVQRLLVEWVQRNARETTQPEYLIKAFRHTLVSALSAALVVSYPNISGDRFKAIHAATLSLESVLSSPVFTVIEIIHAKGQYAKPSSLNTVQIQVIEWVQSLGRNVDTPIYIVDALREELCKTRSQQIENSVRFTQGTPIHLSWLEPQQLIRTKPAAPRNVLARSLASLHALFDKTWTTA